MRNIIMLLIVGILLIIGILHIPITMAIPNPRVISLNVSSVGNNGYNNGIIVNANVILNAPGNIRYVEEYYKISGSSYLIFVSSEEFYNGGLSNLNGTYYTKFEFLRPRSNSGKNYQIIKEIVLFNNVRIFENWNDRSQIFNDNTPEDVDETDTPPSENIIAHEVREHILSSSPSIFKYTSLDSIYEIDATGKGDTSLRIDIFKDAPIATYLSNGTVYRYINLATDNLNIDNLSFKYKTEISWVQNQSIKTIGLFIWKEDEKSWDGLPTTIIGQDNQFIYYESVSNSHLSSNNYFAIIGFGLSAKAIDNTSVNNVDNKSVNNGRIVISNDSSVNQKDEPLIKNIPGFDFFLTIIVIFLMMFGKKSEK